MRDPDAKVIAQRQDRYRTRPMVGDTAAVAIDCADCGVPLWVDPNLVRNIQADGTSVDIVCPQCIDWEYATGGIEEAVRNSLSKSPAIKAHLLADMGIPEPLHVLVPDEMIVQASVKAVRNNPDILAKFIGAATVIRPSLRELRDMLRKAGGK